MFVAAEKHIHILCAALGIHTNRHTNILEFQHLFSTFQILKKRTSIRSQRRSSSMSPSIIPLQHREQGQK